jgi:probable FeS assembly SUF system protein SufT
MNLNEIIELKRDCAVIEIPSGIRSILSKGSRVRVAQALGTSYTVTSEMYAMYRIDAKDADALGLEIEQSANTSAGTTFNEEKMWETLKTVFDPEIPVNVVDLGLIYSCTVSGLEQGGKRIDAKMSMTAPGCGMGNVLKAEVESKLSQLPEVKEVQVEVVFDPPWHPGLMSEAAKLQLGFDLDYGQTSSSFPMMR